MNILAKKIVIEAVEEINQETDEACVIGQESDFQLLSSSSSIDSLTLVRLLISVERIIEERTGKALVVVDESVFDLEQSPFSTIGTLTDHVAKLIG